MTDPSIPARDKAIVALTVELAKLSILIEGLLPLLFSICIDRIMDRAKRPDGGHEESYIFHNAHWYAGVISQILDDHFVNIDAGIEWNDIASEMMLRMAEPSTSH